MTGENDTHSTAAAQRRIPRPSAERNIHRASSRWHPRGGRRRWRLAQCGLTLLALFAAACKGPAPVNLGTDRPSEQWDCRPGAEGGWNCVQNVAGARAGGLASAGRSERPRLSADTHRELAYRPERATPLLDLPGDYYALQLAIRDSREALGRFAEAYRLIGLPHVRVARRGRLAYVLLAGVYRDRADAERARDGLPKRLGSMRPWIRRLHSLQSAMLRADALTGSSTARTVRLGGADAR